MNLLLSQIFKQICSVVRSCKITEILLNIVLNEFDFLLIFDFRFWILFNGLNRLIPVSLHPCHQKILNSVHENSFYFLFDLKRFFLLKLIFVKNFMQRLLFLGRISTPDWLPIIIIQKVNISINKRLSFLHKFSLSSKRF